MSATHFRFLDLLKAFASNLIVLHHLAFYGPMSDHVRPIMPEMMEWLETQARIAVHAFLAIGGFLAARSLSPHGRAEPIQPLHTVLRRFAKLVPPFMAATLLAIAASALAAQWMTHESISPAPTFAQFAAHGLLLHSVLGFESLSAGAWYVAIDFQLYALFTLLLWCVGWFAAGRRTNWLLPVLVAIGTGASLLYFNLDADWDVWAPYFFGSYGLGALAWWAADSRRGPLAAASLTALILLLGGIALEFDFRSRIAVALAISLALVAVCRWGLVLPGQNSRVAAFLGRISYAVFLVHFPVCLVINAAFTRFASPSPEVQAAGMLLAWAASIVAGSLFHQWIEIPLARLLASGRAIGSPGRAPA
ncbi:MAG TPA: acyltransferase [Noviherbaspirillum sp.]|nr:acyltransferase [Noviherbaspirillum sp.]